jgi:hypothetical protein
VAANGDDRERLQRTIRFTRANADQLVAETLDQRRRLRELQAHNQEMRERLRNRDEWVTFQAQGMVVTQANVPLVDAMKLIDEYADENGLARREVAQRVVDRRLRFNG